MFSLRKEVIVGATVRPVKYEKGRIMTNIEFRKCDGERSR